MVKDLRGKNVAGVYSRQIPRRNTTPMEEFFLRDKYKSKKIVRRFTGDKKKSMYDIHFSDRSSCMKRKLLLKYPYAEDLVLAEDQKWAKEMLEKGYTIIYEPKSEVYHSHNYTLTKVFKKWFDVGSAFSRIGKTESSTRFLMVNGLKYYMKEMLFLIKKHPIWIPYAVVYDFLKFAGYIIGKQERYLPLFLKKRLSLYNLHWKQRK